MKTIISFFEKLITQIAIYYIDFVYKTSKVVSTGAYHSLDSDHSEKYIIAIWHGHSYSLYPYLRGNELFVITTKNGRGDYISLICKHFGYTPIRVPDESEGGSFLFKIRRQINGQNVANLCITLDGPLGPYHEPKAFPFITALLTKRQVLPLSINCKYKFHLRRWDKFAIPLPFNKIEVHIHEPIEVTKKDLEQEAITLRGKVRIIMDK